MASISTTSFGQDWLKNFDPPGQLIAKSLVDRLMLVGASEFTSGINSQLTKLNEEAEAGKATIALFAEREVPKVNYEVQPIFPEFEWTCNGFVPVSDLIMPPLLRTPAG